MVNETTTKFLMTDEYYPPNVIGGIIGTPQAGKTLWTYEQGYAITKQGDGVYYIGTSDEPTTFFLDMWKDAMEKKYAHDIKLDFDYAPNAIELLRIVGIDGEIELGEKNEFKIKKMELVKSKLFKALTDKDIKYLVFDSITAPFDVIAVGGRQNLPLRAQVETVFFNSLMEVLRMANKPVRIMTTHHVTFNPTNPYEIKEHILYKGGKIIGHYTKVIYALEHKDRPHGYRQLHVVRYPTLGEYSKTYELLITNEGYRATTKEEVEDMKKKARELKAQERGY